MVKIEIALVLSVKFRGVGIEEVQPHQDGLARLDHANEVVKRL